MTPARVTLSRAKGWKMPPNTVSVARPTRWGNQFQVPKGHPWKDAAWSVLQFSFWIDRLERFPDHPNPPAIADIRTELHGKNLACWCKPVEPCHADALMELANEVTW